MANAVTDWAILPAPLWYICCSHSVSWTPMTPTLPGNFLKRKTHGPLTTTDPEPVAWTQSSAFSQPLSVIQMHTQIGWPSVLTHQDCKFWFCRYFSEEIHLIIMEQLWEVKVTGTYCVGLEYDSVGMFVWHASPGLNPQHYTHCSWWFTTVIPAPRR